MSLKQILSQGVSPNEMPGSPAGDALLLLMESSRGWLAGLLQIFISENCLSGDL